MLAAQTVGGQLLILGYGDTRVKLLLGYGIRGKKISGIRDTYEYRGIPDTRSIMYLGYGIPGLALWDTKIFIGIRDTMHRKMGSSPPKVRNRNYTNNVLV